VRDWFTIQDQHSYSSIFPTNTESPGMLEKQALQGKFRRREAGRAFPTGDIVKPVD